MCTGKRYCTTTTTTQNVATGQQRIILQSPKSRMHKSINSNMQLTNLCVRTERMEKWTNNKTKWLKRNRKKWFFEIYVEKCRWCVVRGVKIHSNLFYLRNSIDIGVSRHAGRLAGSSGFVIVTIRPGKHHKIKVLKPKRFVVCANSE